MLLARTQRDGRLAVFSWRDQHVKLVVGLSRPKAIRAMAATVEV